MAENSPIRRNRGNHGPSPRKHPYEKPGTPGKSGRPPLRNIQAPLQPQVAQPPPQKIQVFGNHKKNEPKPAPVPAATVNKKPDFGVIGENRIRRGSSFGFIPVEQSCIIGGDEMHTSENSSLNLSSSDSDSGWNPFSSVNVTSGVLGQLQPRGLNSSFTEKFESRLGLNSNPTKVKENQENEGLQQKSHVQPFSSSQPRGILTERFNPLFDFPEYTPEILKYWGIMEKKFKVKWDYMERHKMISHKMRTILVDWLVEVVNEYDLTEEALHLAVNYLDRFLCVMNVKRTKLQLVGAAALFIAAKFEETHPPEVADFVYVTDEAYTKLEILGMERCMLTVLEFDLMMPTPHYFVLSYCSILRLSDPIKCLAMYLVDLSLMEGEIFLKFLPSVIAGAAVALGRYVFDNNFWDGKLQGICPHRKKTIAPCARQLHKQFFDASHKPQTSVYDKYQTVRYCSVANMFIPHNGPWDEEPPLPK